MKAVLALLGLVALARAQNPKVCGAADIVFIVDASGSIGPSNFRLVLNFMIDLVNEFKVGPQNVQFGMIKYTDTRREHEFYLNTYQNKADIINKLNKTLYYGGGSFTGAAIQEAADQMFTRPRGLRWGVPSIAIVITDGRSYDDVTRPSYNLQAKYVQTFAVGIGHQVRQTELETISSDPDQDFVFHINGFAGLQKIESMLAMRTHCGFRTLPTTLTPPPTPPTLKPVTNFLFPTQKPNCNTNTHIPTAGPTRSPPIGPTAAPLPTAGPTWFQPPTKIPPPTKKRTCGPIITNRPVVINAPVLSSNAPVKVTQVPTTAPQACTNILSDCVSYGKDICSYKEWAKTNCYQYCGYCTGSVTPASGPCIDGLPDCGFYGKFVGNAMCTTPGYEAWVKQNCAKFCKTC